MKIGLFIDYANLYINIKNDLNLSTVKEIENEINISINKLEEYLSRPNKFSDKGIKIVKKVAYVLENNGFGNPKETFKNSSIEIKTIQSSKKTDSMINMNQSKLDDEVLMEDAMNFSKEVDAILVISNDGDYSNLGKKLKNYSGCLFWVGVYEGISARASRYLINIADLVLPLHDIINNIDEPEPAEFDEEAIIIDDPYIAIYYKGKNILNYPIDKEYIDIGRRSSRRFHFPCIDLSEFDVEKVVSRQHGFIKKTKDTLIFVVDENCSRGTWVDGLPIYSCEQIILKPGMKVILGDFNGFGLEYVI